MQRNLFFLTLVWPSFAISWPRCTIAFNGIKKPDADYSHGQSVKGV
jgi:hypothetical protein